MPNKAIAGAAGAGVGGALAILVISLFWPTATPEAAGALNTVFSAIIAFASTYITPHNGSSS